MIWKLWTRTKPDPSHPKGYVADEARANVFDPALRQYLNAFVKGPPRFQDREQKRRFEAERSRMLRRILSVVAGSDALREHLVVRGSVALEHWFGEDARPARDIDFVVQPASWSPESTEAEQLLSALSRGVLTGLGSMLDRVSPKDVHVDAIWTYERAEGCRVTLPWIFENVIDVLQLDVVFCEELQDPPVRLELDELTGRASVRFASRAESLAWKLMWLETDAYPQAKDLYDACLLAESTPLSGSLLDRVFRAKGMLKDGQRAMLGPKRWQEWIDWDMFALEHPDLADRSAEALVARFNRALRITE
ncbi:MAG: nucleotidyl transferase AbiEii/AbiGii toxin family protein [Sandaracinaceae bacterium]